MSLRIDISETLKALLSSRVRRLSGTNWYVCIATVCYLNGHMSLSIKKIFRDV